MHATRKRLRQRPIYPTWIRSGRIVFFWQLACGLLALGLALAVVWPPALIICAAALPILYIAIVLSWTSHQLSPRGKDVQGRIHELLIEAVGRDGRLLDIGCGSGQLLIRFAKSAPGDYVGLDYWGADWEYSRAQAERNAALENVPGLAFHRASASNLPFRDGEFRRVVSSLTFHEVADVKDKTASIGQALRVLGPGGRFAFIDLFDDPKFYTSRQSVLDAIERNGGRVQAAKGLSELLDLRFPLTLGKVLGYAVFVSGEKAAMRDQPAQAASV